MTTLGMKMVKAMLKCILMKMLEFGRKP